MRLRTAVLSTALSLAGMSSAAIAANQLNLDGVDPAYCGTGTMAAEYTAPDTFVAMTTEFKSGQPEVMLKGQRADLHSYLMAVRPDMSTVSGFEAKLSRSDLVKIGAAEPLGDWQLQVDERRYQVGVGKSIATPMDFSKFNPNQLPKSGNINFANGIMTPDGQGGFVWATEISSPGATGIKVGIENFRMPEGVSLYAYTERGDAFGPYAEWGPNDTGTFWTNATVGSKMTLQLHIGAEAADKLGQIGFKIADIGHLGPRFGDLAAKLDPGLTGPKAFCSFNADCVENVNCGASSVVNDAKKAVAEMIYQSGGGYYICTGGLLADTDTNSVVPLFLTANHCLSSGNEASSLEAIFDFEVACNTGTCPRYGDGFNVRTNGSSVLATNSTSDYTLLQLAQTPGGDRAYLGWTNAEIAFSNGANLYRVSHPAGAPQAYSEHDVDTNKGTCRTWPRGNWIYSTDTLGATEGGSSGSPVLNSSGQVVGQLSGGCGTNVNETCDSVNNATVDGALAAYFNDVASFLDPDGGTEPPSQCDLLPKGASCSSDSECCSNKCKGKRGAKTCK